MSRIAHRSAHRIVVAEFLPEAALALLREAGEVVGGPDLHARRPELLELLHDAEALVVRNQTRVDTHLLEGAPRLRVVGRVGTGLDNFELAALRERGVTLTYSPGANAASVAEYVMGAVLTVYRRFVPVAAAVAAGGWDRQAATGRELVGGVMGIVGLGDIGARVARRARAFGMTVVATDPYLHEASPAVQENGVTLLPLEALLERSDVVTLHSPLSPATRHLLGEEQLALMRPGSLLVNTGRGGLLDEPALARALRRGRPAAAVLDVRDPEPPGEDDPLRGAPNLLVTPHVAGVTEQALERGACHVARDVVRVLSGRPPVSAVPT